MNALLDQLQQLPPFVRDVARLVVWLVLLIAIFVPLERLFSIEPSKFWRKQIGVDLCWYFINSLVPTFLLSVPLAVLARTMSGLNPGGYYTAVAAWPLWVRLPLAVLLNDFGTYWGHRLMHSHRVLWRFHAIHHSAEHVDWLVNTRAHPFDMVFTRLAGFTPVYLFGLAPSTGPNMDNTVALLTIFGTVWTFFIHSNIRVRMGPLEWVISSPAFHHWHHSIDEHRESNYAFVFPFIDRIFGTAWLPRQWPPGYGIKAKMPSTLSGQFFDPMV